MSIFGGFKEQALQRCQAKYKEIGPTWTAGPITEFLFAEPTEEAILAAIPKRINGDMIAALIAERPELLRMKTSWAWTGDTGTLPELFRGLVAFLILKDLEPELRAAAAAAGVPTHEQYYDGEPQVEGSLWPSY